MATPVQTWFYRPHRAPSGPLPPPADTETCGPRRDGRRPTLPLEPPVAESLRSADRSYRITASAAKEAPAPGRRRDHEDGRRVAAAAAARRALQQSRPRICFPQSPGCCKILATTIQAAAPSGRDRSASQFGCDRREALRLERPDVSCSNTCMKFNWSMSLMGYPSSTEGEKAVAVTDSIATSGRFIIISDISKLLSRNIIMFFVGRLLV